MCAVWVFLGSISVGKALEIDSLLDLHFFAFVTRSVPLLM